MDWGQRLMASWRGEVSNADLGAMFASAAGLDTAKQALADQRLAADIEHSGHEWRAVLAVGRIAAPLWLADALVALAGAFYDAETQAHPDRPTSINPYTHALVATLLAPIEDILADVIAALADATRRAPLTSPVGVGPGRDIAAYAPPVPMPAAYARGLLAGARRLHTSAAAALAALQKVCDTSSPPDWLVAGTRHLNADLQAAGTRLDVIELRLTPLLDEHGESAETQASVCRDLWFVVNGAVVAGQLIADPHLMPEAASIPHVAAAGGSGASGAPGPRKSPPRTRFAAFPTIPEGAPDPHVEQAPQQSAASRTEPTSPAAFSLPAIGGEPSAPSPPTPKAPSASSPLPTIGESAPAAQPGKAGSGPERCGNQSRDPSPASDDQPPPLRFPDIG